MNLYFLVEGRRSEARIYPSWIARIAPNLTRVHFSDLAEENNYFLFSAEGYPSVLQTHLKNAVADIRRVGRYDCLVVILDSEEYEKEERTAETQCALERCGVGLPCRLEIVVQHRCIETWLLANRRLIPANPTSDTLRRYLNHFNVRIEDPEAMPKMAEFSTHAHFHLAYVKAAFEERRIVYSKRSPGHAADAAFVDQLRQRVADQPGQLRSFQRLLRILSECESTSAD